MTSVEGRLAGSGLRIAIACSRFNDTITERLLAGAQGALRRHGVEESAVYVAWVPGAFELPLLVRRLARSRRHDAVIALGAIIRGATDHYEYVAGQCAAGLQQASLDSGIPVVFGVLTTDTIEQAIERSGTKAGNRGADAAAAAIEMVNVLRAIPESSDT